MNARQASITSVLIIALGAAGYGLYSMGLDRGMKAVPPTPVGDMKVSPAGGDGKSTDASGRRILYWHDPMVPGQKFDKPGKSPYMDMQLVPVYADEGTDTGQVAISARVQQNLGVRTAEVTRGTLAPVVEAVGSVAYNDRDVVVVQARSNGFIEKLHVRAPLDPVRKGQTLAEIYVPEWVSAQEEYLSARRIAGSGLGTLLEGLQDGARQRMRLVGMTDEQIHLVESTATVHARSIVTAPMSGVVTELGAREGMTVTAGSTLFRINSLDTVWVNAEVPEVLSAHVRPGNVVQARTPALPGVTFKGHVAALLPEVNVTTRTIKARVELANPGGRLVSGMFATVNFAPSAPRDVLLVPTEAIIRTGTRSVVILAQEDGKFLPVDVEAGMESGDRTEVVNGLAAGQKVVVSGQFLIDSEASLRGSSTRMGAAPSTGPATKAAADSMHHAEGKVEYLGKGEVTLSHGAVPELKWSAMTMPFKLATNLDAKSLKVGDRVHFVFRQTDDGAYEVVSFEAAISKDTVSAPAADEHRSGAHGTVKAAGTMKEKAQ
jgi:Cu(I)/Ag(I) efflux system membrane fusion protein